MAYFADATFILNYILNYKSQPAGATYFLMKGLEARGIHVYVVCHPRTVLLLEQIAGLALGSMITWKTSSLARQDRDIMVPEPWVVI